MTDFLKSICCCNYRFTQPLFQFCTIKHSEKRTRTCCKGNSVPCYSLLPFLLVPVKTLPLPLPWSLCCPFFSSQCLCSSVQLTHSGSQARECVWHFNRGRFQTNRWSFWHEKPSLPEQRRWVDWQGSAKYFLCSPVFPLWSLWHSSFCCIWSLSTLNSFSFTLWTFSPVTARTCLDEWLSAFLVCKHPRAGKLKKKIMSNVASHFSDI